ncbi:N-acetylneuraminate synthase family protein [Roseibium sediminis]|uniref:N-acetylneuraminate synthase family protein n=1 Tax=Roseibium sediminis TaxID=1775174 RepID=UPI00123CF0DB|nr:N-acetylneuraminate synthase family protein [Roseibium sediminis]
MTSQSGISVIAEIGCNHKGSMDIACEMIQIAARDCKVEAAKFQKRHNRSLLPPQVYDAPHPVPANSYGRTYGEHREFLEFTVQQHKELMEECRLNGIVYSTSVWDVISAQEIAALKPQMIKVPSATNQNFEVQEYLCRHYDGEIHVSVGMTTRDEVEACIGFYEKMGRAKDLVVYACTSGYPVPAHEVCLLEINRLQERFTDRIKAFGFSGHHEGIAIDMAAAAVGISGTARHEASPFAYIERHFTLNRAWKGTDHSASLEPADMAQLRAGLDEVCAAMTHKYTDVLDIEIEQRRKLKWMDMSGAARRKALLNKVS